MLKRTILTLIILSFLPFSGSAQTITTIAGTGTPGYSGDGGPALLAEIAQPVAVAADNYGNVYFSDIYSVGSRVRKINSSGIISTIAGTGVDGYNGDGGPATDAQIHVPGAIALDGSGNIYFADTRNYRIRKIDLSGIITTFAGDGDGGSYGDGGQATAAGIGIPDGITFDRTGNLLFTSHNFVRKIDVYGIISTIAGTGVHAYSGDGGPASAAEIVAGGLAVDATGNLFISDGYYNVVRKVNTVGIISTIAGNGISGYSGDGGPAVTAQLGGPTGMSIDAAGNLYICEMLNTRIRIVNSAGIITTIAGGGSCAPYAVGDGGPATDGCLARPNDVKVDNEGNLFIADDVDWRVRKVGGVTGVGSFTNQTSALIVYPNPSEGTFTTNLSSGAEEPVHIFITDLIGKVVKEINSATNRNIDISLDVSPGMYFFSAFTAHEEWNQKIVIER